ncbi:MAG: hypothetical protein Q9165_000558 [Trypethelium subeluteriae]
MKFLTGAPAPGSLNWLQGELLDEFIPCFCRFFEGKSSGGPPLSSVSLTTDTWPSWRTVTTVLLHDEPSKTSDNDQNKRQCLAGPTTRTRADDLYDQVSNQVSEDLDESFAVHEFFEPSQIAPNAQFNTDLSLLEGSNYESFVDFGDPDYSTAFNVDDSLLDRQTFPTKEHLTDLSALPSADYLKKILPGTMTIDIIVAVVDISPTRTVTIRRQGSSYDMNIVELYVRDETKAGLKISIWLKPEARPESRSPSHAQMRLRSLISLLRRGDVVFMKNVALRSYQGEVCGQTLSNERYPNIGTRLALLSRREGLNWGEAARDKLDNLPHPHATKLERVQSWIMQFMGLPRLSERGESKGTKISGKRKLESRELPADTQSDSES